MLSSRADLFPFLRGQLSELWQLTSWLESGHHVLLPDGVSEFVKQLKGYNSEYYL